MAEQRFSDDVDLVLRVFQHFRGALISQGRNDWVDLDLSMAQLKAIFVIQEAGALTVSGFAKQVGTKPSAASILIERMVKGGYVERQQDAQDRRRMIIVLSDKGRSLVDRLQQRPARLRELLERLRPEELAGLAAGLLALARAAGAEIPTSN